MKNTLFIFLLLPLFSHAQIITTVAGTGIAGYSGDSGPASKAEFTQPQTAVFDKAGNLFITDVNNHVIRKVDPSGIITTIAGTGVCSYSGDGGPAIKAALCSPTDLTLDNLGNIYVVDFGNNRIRMINALGIITTIVDSNGARGYGGDGGPAISAKIADPYGICIDKSGNLYFSDGSNHKVRKVSPSGIITTYAGKGTKGDSGDGGPATAAEMEFPGYMALGNSGELYISDWTAHKVRMVNALGKISTVAGNGALGYSGDGGPATAAMLNSPNGMAVDKYGNFYISDVYGYMIRKVNTAGIISTIAGKGIKGYSGDGGLATDAEINNPDGIFFDSIGNFYIVDAGNNRIRKITPGVNVSNQNIDNNIIAIYPNPAEDQLTITATNPITSLTIANALGRLILNQKCDKQKSMQIDISSFPSGIYFIKVNSAYVQKIIKQ